MTVRAGIRRPAILGLAAVAAMALTACGVGPREQVGAVLGGAAGGVAGAQIGSGTGQLAATATGAGLGTLAGAGVGRSLDRQARRAAPTREGKTREVALVPRGGRTGIRRLQPLVADPTRQVPIPGAHVPGSFWSWLPDLSPPAPMRNLQRVAAPGDSEACVPLDGPRLKSTFRCTTGGATYVLQ